MTQGELNRVGIIPAVAAGDLSRRRTAFRLNLSARQVKRLKRGYREHGVRGLGGADRAKPAINTLAVGTCRLALAPRRG